MSAKRVTRMERRALRLLRSAARTNACGRVAEAEEAGFLAFAGFGPLGHIEGATGEVEAARYASRAAHRSSGAGRAATRGHSLLDGIKVPPEAGQAMAIMMIALASLLVVGVLFGDRQLGPRFHEWRSRWIRRPPV
jgi:hypothetical protein